MLSSNGDHRASNINNIKRVVLLMLYIINYPYAFRDKWPKQLRLLLCLMRISSIQLVRMMKYSSKEVHDALYRCGIVRVFCKFIEHSFSLMKDVNKYYKEDNKNEIVSWDSWHEYENKKQNYERIKLFSNL